MRAIFILMALLVVLSPSACTTEQAYYTAQGWKRNQCNKLPDKAEFDRCMSDTNTAYESYRRQTEPGQSAEPAQHPRSATPVK